MQNENLPEVVVHKTTFLRNPWYVKLSVFLIVADIISDMILHSLIWLIVFNIVMLAIWGSLYLNIRKERLVIYKKLQWIFIFFYLCESK